MLVLRTRFAACLDFLMRRRRAMSHTGRWLFGMRRWRLNWFHSDCRLTIATAGRPCHRKAANEEKNDCGGFAFAIEMYPAAPARLTFRVKCIRVSLP